ncbi:unnamed protein product, partial [Heterosigma akashiwo]
PIKRIQQNGNLLPSCLGSPCYFLLCVVFQPWSEVSGKEYAFWFCHRKDEQRRRCLSPGGLPRQVVDFKIKLDSSPDDVFFEETMGIISSNYDYTEKPFKNGELSNAAGENGGSCKVFSFGKLAVLSEQQTLNCFGEHYRDVLSDPDGTAHGNIRNFMTKGWNGIEFGEGLGLTLKKK